MDDPRQQIILKLARDRPLAHATLFQHRHPSETPEFHHELIRHWHSDVPKFLAMAFRGGAKSTIGEECLIVEALLREFHNGIILGDSETRAKERLTSIKHEFESNEIIHELFGDMVGPTWGETKIVLSNGVAIQAYGAGQSLRGVKHHQYRPDRVFIDDLEDEESVATPEARDKKLKYLVKVVLPAMSKNNGRIRMNATPLDPEALPMKLQKASDWVTKVYPIKSRDPTTGAWRATWPDHFPMSEINRMEQEYAQLGASKEFAQEYMCEAVDPASQTFTPDMFRVEPVVRTWQATYAFVDPARTVKNTSASTGWAVWSWINSRLIVWDAGAGVWMPDQIVDQLFVIDQEFSPVSIGVEEDGLNEFIMQPIRQEQARRGYMLPVLAMKAPRGKIDFIKGLQPFFKAKEVVFAKPLPDLQQQLVSFPTGRIDAPNALAYALRMRPGAVVYDAFSVGNIAEDLPVLSRAPLWLALNATPQFTTAALCQLVNGAVHVLWDNVREGDPGTTLHDVIQSASLFAGQNMTFCAGPRHFSDHDTVGLRGAAAKIPVALRRGAPELNGRDEVRALLRRQIRGVPALRVAHAARWTLNAFSGGYAFEILKTGQLSDFTRVGPHRTLVEGLESFAGLLRSAIADGDETRHYDRTASGARYLTARPVEGHRAQDLKRG